MFELWLVEEHDACSTKIRKLAEYSDMAEAMDAQCYLEETLRGDLHVDVKRGVWWMSGVWRREDAHV